MFDGPTVAFVLAVEQVKDILFKQIVFIILMETFEG